VHLPAFEDTMVPTSLRAAWRRLPLLASLMLAPATMTVVAAEPERRTARPDPTDAAAVVPKAAYESSLRPVRRPADAKPPSWREANDTVTRIGGWRAYARESLPGAAASAPAGHAGHRAP
jgi:hypothetical protein